MGLHHDGSILRKLLLHDPLTDMGAKTRTKHAQCST